MSMTPNPLQPGAEVDAEVAQAMGWTHVQDSGWALRGTPPGGGETEDVPEFSTSMDAAMLFAEHALKDGFRLSLHTRTVGYEVHVYYDFPFKIIASKTHKSAAAAICLAFLAAVASGRKERT